MIRLRMWEEVVGIFKGFHLSDDGHLLNIYLEPSNTIEVDILRDKGLIDKLMKIPRGTRIGVIKTDKDLRIREIKEINISTNG
jgi:hypothetical protein